MSGGRFPSFLSCGLLVMVCGLLASACAGPGADRDDPTPPVGEPDVGAHDGAGDATLLPDETPQPVDTGEMETGDLPTSDSGDPGAPDGGDDSGGVADGAVCSDASCPAGQACVGGSCQPIDGDKDGVTSDLDCDDEDRHVYPDAPEFCDAKDNDCDGETDEDFDADADGSPLCDEAGAFADCDDEDPEVHPGAIEVCNGVDDDCDGETDEGNDTDGDGFLMCAADPADRDCNDGDEDVFPGADETCNGTDDDCDGKTDEDFDVDGDGYIGCAAAGIWEDCDDGDPEAHPSAAERCNGADDDCDGETDEDFDGDGDGFSACGGDPSQIDCDEEDGSVHPGADEECNGVDDDCDGSTDEVPDCIGCSDGKRDGFGDIPRWPVIAACKGEFGRGSLRRDRTNTVCGDDLAKNCPAPEDLCAQGWHICMRNGFGSDMRFRLTTDECRSLPNIYVAATNNCSNDPSISPAKTGCNMTEPFGCYPTGWCSAPVACGPTETSHCAHAVWPGGTRIFGIHAGRTENNGCANIASTTSYGGKQGKLTGVLCCKDL